MATPNVFQFHTEETTSWPRSNSNLPAKHRPPPTAQLVHRCVVLAMACAIARRCPRPKPNAPSVKPCGNESIKPALRQRPRKVSASHRSMTEWTQGRPHARTPVGNRLVTMLLPVAARTATHRHPPIRALGSLQEVRPTLRLVGLRPNLTRRPPVTTSMAVARPTGQARHTDSHSRTIANPVAPAP